MKVVKTERRVNIPPKVTVTTKGRNVTVTGPRGSLTRSFDVRCTIELQGKRSLVVTIWAGEKRHLACLRTTTAHIENMITGVTKGFLYKLRMAYSHFPINVDFVEAKGASVQTVEIRNFLGQKRVRIVEMIEGVKATRSEDVKDQIELVGNDIEAVSKCAARIHQACLVRNKDIRKFLDGIYVSEKGAIGALKAI
jgi:large subunit ribosomal protein L9e